MQKKNNTKINATASTLRTAPYIFEGDIILQPKQALEVVEMGKRRQKRKLHANTVLLWKLPIWFTFHPDEYSKWKKSKHLDEFVHVRGNSFKLTVLNVLDFIDKKPL